MLLVRRLALGRPRRPARPPRGILPLLEERDVGVTGAVIPPPVVSDAEPGLVLTLLTVICDQLFLLGTGCRLEVRLDSRKEGRKAFGTLSRCL